MKKILMMLAILPLTMSVAACKRGHSKNPVAAVKEAVKDKDLQRTWQSECDEKNIVQSWVNGGLKSKRTLYTFAGNDVTITTVWYSQPACAQEAYMFLERGVFKIDDKQRSNDGGHHIDFDLRNLVATIRDQAGADAANKLTMCGRKDWTPGNKEQDVTGQSKNLSCYGAQVPRKVLNLYRIDGGTLYLGNQTAATLTGERPSTLNFGERYSSK